MAILTMDQYASAPKQYVRLLKTGARTTVANGWFSPFDLAGSPGAGTLAGSSTTVGVVPTDATTGCPIINAFGSDSRGYITRVDYSSSVACRIAIFDILWKGGAYAFNANTAVTSPQWDTRISNGDYGGTEIWVEQVTAATGNQAVTVTYKNQNDIQQSTAHTAGAVGIGAAPTVGRCWQLPLSTSVNNGIGVKSIGNVAGSIASVGTFNVLVLRRLWEGRIRAPLDGAVDDLLCTGMPEVFSDSALVALVCPDSTAIGVFELNIQITNG